MTDYLEQFFAVQTEPEEETAVFRIPAPFGKNEETEPEVSTKPAADVEIKRHETLRRVEQTVVFPEEERPGFPIHRPVGERAEEALERRLRRDSRRYDSGFYWY